MTHGIDRYVIWNLLLIPYKPTFRIEDFRRQNEEDREGLSPMFMGNGIAKIDWTLRNMESLVSMPSEHYIENCPRLQSRNSSRNKCEQE